MKTYICAVIYNFLIFMYKNVKSNASPLECQGMKIFMPGVPVYQFVGLDLAKLSFVMTTVMQMGFTDCI